MKQVIGCSVAACSLLAAMPVMPAEVSRDNVVAMRVGDVVYIRSWFSPTQDVVIKVTGKFGYNHQVNFLGGALVSHKAPMTPAAHEAGEPFHGCGDDATPWNINSTYIGGNHGDSDVLQVTAKAHGLTVADTGSAWRDEAGTTFHVIKVDAPDRVLFLSDNVGKGPYWRFIRAIKGSKLTRSDKDQTLPVESVQVTQLWPACRIARQEYLVDGKTPLSDGRAVACEYLDVVDEYDIICPDAVLEAVKTAPGKAADFVAPGLEAVIGNRIVYRFLPQGACVIRHHAEAKRDFQLGYMGFIQSAPLRKAGFDTQYYVPKTLPFTVDQQRFDFRGIQDFSLKLTKSCDFTAANGNLENPSNPPERFIQFLGKKENGGVSRKIGYALGYSLIEGITRPALRARNARMPLWIYTSSKTYPHAIDEGMGKEVKAGTVFDCVAYRQYFDAAADPNATCVYGHLEGDDYILYADYHRSVEKDVLAVPAKQIGARIELIEKTPSVTILSGDKVLATGLALSVKGDYGYVVVKLVPPGR